MLSHLAQALPSILIKDRAPKTIHTYLRAFSAWKLWATGCSTTPLPVEPAVFCLYLMKLIQENKSVSAINTAVYGVSWVQKKVGQPEVADDPVVKQVVKAAKRILSKPPERKKALKVEQVMSIITSLEKNCIADLRVASLFALGFFGFLRWDDLRNLRREDLEFAESHVAVFLQQRKTSSGRDPGSSQQGGKHPHAPWQCWRSFLMWVVMERDIHCSAEFSTGRMASL